MPEKKILYLITHGEWGGAQKYIYDLATHLPPKEFKIFIASGKGTNQELNNKLKIHKITAFQVKHLIRSINPVKDLLALFALVKLIKKIRPDIIHLNSSKISILGSLAGKIV